MSSLSESYVKSTGEVIIELLWAMMEILSASDEFSLYKTLEALRLESDVSNGFEETLKNNTTSVYCRSNVYETVKELFIPEQKQLQKLICAYYNDR